MNSLATLPRRSESRSRRREQSRVTAARTVSPQAYDAYLRGRYLWLQRSPGAIASAINYFQQAVREDPGFALAYSGLADCYWIGWGAKVDFPLAEQYARKAISLQPDLAEGHTSLGALFLYEHQMADAQKELRRAIELNPSYAMAHHYYALYLVSMGLPADALAENERGRQLDPFTIPINAARTFILIGLRQYDRALEQARRFAELFPQSPVPHYLFARIYWIQGRVPEAIAERKKIASLGELCSTSARPGRGHRRIQQVRRPRCSTQSGSTYGARRSLIMGRICVWDSSGWPQGNAMHGASAQPGGGKRSSYDQDRARVRFST